MKKKSTRKLDSKKLIASTISAAVVVSPIGGSFVVDAAGDSFKDVSKSAYYYEAVQELVQNGVISGYPDGTFKPNNAVTRAEFSAFLVKMLDLDNGSVNNPNFKDVHTNAWYYSSVAALANLGLVGGYEDGSFQPNKQITRAEIAALLTRVCNLSADSSSQLPFTDVPQNAWYKEVVAALYQSKLVAGKTSTTFAPNDNATRAEATVFLQRADSNGLLPKMATAKVEAVTNESVTIDGVVYQISDNLKGIFNETNSTVLKSANISFAASNQTITKVLNLELTASGQAAAADEEEFSKNVVLDGGNSSIDGKLKIAGNYVTIKNVKVSGDLEIGKELQNDFYSQNISVSGKTIINGGDNNTVVFADAALNTVEVNKKDVRVEPKGKTTLKDVVVTSNANITAADGVVIPKLTVKDGVEKLDLNVKVENVVVDTTKEISLYGPKIVKLELVKSTKITLVKGTKVEKLVLPSGVEAKDIIKNYNDVKNDIGKATVGGGGGGGTGSTPSTNINDGKPINSNYVIDIDSESGLVFGPETGATVITGNLTIKGSATDNIKLRNITINGDITIDTANGSVGLESTVKVNGNTIIKDVAYGTFSSSADHGNHGIDIQDTSAAIELSGTASKADVAITNGGAIALKGSFEGAVTVKKAVTLNVEGGAKVSKITAEAKTNIESKSNDVVVAEIVSNTSEPIVLAGEFKGDLKITANNENSKLELSAGTKFESAPKIDGTGKVELGGSGVTTELLKTIETVGDSKLTVSDDVKDSINADFLAVMDARNALNTSEINKSSGGINNKEFGKGATIQLPINLAGAAIQWSAGTNGDKISINNATGAAQITANDFEGPITLTAVLSVGSEKLNKSFIINIDTLQPRINSITFNTKSATLNGKEFSIDLSSLSSETLLATTIDVNQSSALTLNVNNLGSLSKITLTSGKNTINDIGLSNAELSNINLDNINLHDLYLEFADSNISKTDLYQALNINELINLVGADALFNENAINLSGILAAFDNYNVYTKNDLLKTVSAIAPSISLTDEELTKIIGYLEKDDYNSIVNLLAGDPETIQALYNEIGLGNIINKLTKEQFETILDNNVKFEPIFTIIQNKDVPNDKKLGVIDLPQLFRVLGGQGGFTIDLFEILAKVDGDDPNTVTVGLTLSNDDNESEAYSIKMTVGAGVEN